MLCSSHLMSHSQHFSCCICLGFYGELFLWLTFCCTETFLEFPSESRCQCLVMVQTSKETGITTGRKIAMLEHSGRLVSTVQSLKQRSSTTLPRKARLDCIGDTTIDVPQYLLVPGELIAEHMSFFVDFFGRDFETYILHIYYHPWSHSSLRMFTYLVNLWTEPISVNYSFEKKKKKSVLLTIRINHTSCVLSGKNNHRFLN